MSKYLTESSLSRTLNHPLEENKLLEQFLQSKQERKLAEEEVRLLKNRINLLQQEELKAKKHIEETKAKVQSIIEAKVRFQEKQLKRVEVYFSLNTNKYP